MDESTLMSHVDRVRDGDDRSFAAIVAAHGEMLLAVAYRYTGDWESSRDLAQETWISVFKAIRRFDGRIPFRSWLLVVHRNRCIDHLRRRRRSRMFAAPGEGADGYAEAADSSPNPYEAVERRERLEAVLRAAGGLPGRQRKVFALVDIEGIQCREAARILGMREVTLRTNLYHARRGVARALRASGVMRR